MGNNIINNSEIDKVIKHAATAMGVDPELIRQKNRTGNVLLARQMCCYWLHENGSNYKRIVEVLYPAINSHSTVLHACRVISNEMETSEAFAIRYKKFAYSMSGHYEAIKQFLKWYSPNTKSIHRQIINKYYSESSNTQSHEKS
jgi:hypothetical protein